VYRDDHYRDPSLYDLEYEDQTSDVLFYARRCMDAPGPVLELGCGNGRITIPIARAGATVHGIDLADPMLRDLEEKLVEEPAAVRERVSFARADFRSVEGPARYALVLWPFNALHHCASHRDVLQVLRGARDALLPGGRLLMDCYLPDPVLYRRDPTGRYEERHFLDPRSGTPITSWERSSYDPMEQVHTVFYEYQHADGTETVVQLDLRMYYPQELRAVLDWGGFRIVNEAADFKGTPLTPNALKWVAELEPI
jgi:SAM-dependent methyltransferase